ncbi:MAG: peptide-N-glycosidase F-related protein [Minicystis sp.]
MRFSRSASALALLATVALASACGSNNPGTATGGAGGSGTNQDAGVDAPSDDPVPGADAMVAAFDKTPIYFTGDDNKRTVDLPASFPKEGAYSKIILHLSLECPSGGCDPWDRFGSLGVVTQKGTGDVPDTVIEVARFITPYHVGASWDLDVTDLRPLLTGDLTMRAFIDTWVGPGSQYGDGWLLSASFEMTGGIPEKLPVEVVPIWIQRNVVYGDPAKPIADAAPAQMVALPKASSYALRAFITGHGQGNAGNCAEFCQRTHTITAGSTPHAQKIWRTDCATTAAPGQQGTYKYSRAGWCPGADVHPWTIDVTADVAGSTMATFAYDVETYENTCRPDAMPCAGCTLGTSCPYDGGAHTEPNYAISTLLIAYR